MMPSPKSKLPPSLPKIVDTANQQLAFDAIGTRWQIDFYDKLTHEQFASIKTAVSSRIEQFDKTYSRFRPDSLVTKMSQKSGSYKLPANAKLLLKLYKDLYDLTQGKMTPLIGQTLADAGYDAAYCLQPKALSQPPAWEAVLDYQPPTLTLKQPVLFDFGAAGKGYLVDIVAELFRKHGVGNFCIDAGGDIYCQGISQQIGLEHPADASRVIGIAIVINQSICGSSGNRRAWPGFNHIIDPVRLQSPSHLEAVWVVADTALLADALTTALYFVSPDVLHKRYTFEYALLQPGGQLIHSPHFPAELFSNQKNL